MVVLEFIALVSSILYIEVVDFRAQYPQCVTLESFIILKLPLQHGGIFIGRIQEWQNISLQNSN